MLKDIKSQEVRGLDKDEVRASCIFASCFTCHSAQGSSIDGDITIFDYNHVLVRNYREFLWTAITRTRDLSKVKFFKYSDDTEGELNKQNRMSYFNRKVVNYKVQDRNARREIPKVPKEGYVNTQLFLDNIKNQCNYCGCGFALGIRKGNIPTNLTAQGKDNDTSHTLDNCIAYCCRCNSGCK